MSTTAWSANTVPLPAGRVTRTTVHREGLPPLSYEAVLELWRDDRSFRTFFDRLLAEAPYEAFLWETPPVTRATLQRPFEFVLVDSPALAAMPVDPVPFRDELSGGEDVVAFSNLGGDAILVAPTARGPLEAYAHLATFVRGAPEEQRHAFWRVVALALVERLADERLWVSTSGLGVAWLHVRLDDRPKYVTHAEYRTG